VIQFLDSSALVKRYIQERGSELIRSLVSRRRDIATSRLSYVEISAALFRRARAGDLSEESVKRHVGRLARDLEEVQIVEIRPPVLELAVELVQRHPLRAYDAVQLASALRLVRGAGLPVAFVCADSALSRAAGREGMRTQCVS